MSAENRFFLGCDGGSTKYDYAVCDASGGLRARRVFPGVNILEKGYPAFTEELCAHVRAVLGEAGLSPEAVTYAAFSLSGYGESATAERDMRAAARKALGHDRFVMENDAVGGWAGALRMQPGVVVSSGTGSVAYGEDGHGGAARAGGWSLEFGDEGSAYWVASRVLNLFYRQADGRLPRSMLYDWMMARFGLAHPLHLPYAFHERTRGDVSKVAAFQRDALELCQAGDAQVLAVYAQAGRELAALIAALNRRLRLDKPFAVSYTGSLFKAGACVLAPFTEAAETLGARVVPPAIGPLAGALGLAAREALPPDAVEGLMGAEGVRGL